MMRTKLVRTVDKSGIGNMIARNNVTLQRISFVVCAEMPDTWHVIVLIANVVRIGVMTAPALQDPALLVLDMAMPLTKSMSNLCENLEAQPRLLWMVQVPKLVLRLVQAKKIVIVITMALATVVALVVKKNLALMVVH